MKLLNLLRTQEEEQEERVNLNITIKKLNVCMQLNWVYYVTGSQNTSI